VRKSLYLICAVMTALLVLVMAFGTASAAPAAQEGGDTEPPPVQVPFLEEWMSSGHADATAEAFIHWNEESPAEVPESCAKCHSSTGYQDFLGADGTEAGVVNAPHPVGTVVDCVACHNDVTVTKTSVVMPSGLEITGLGGEARCMECHQGRQSKVSVDQAIADAGVDADTVSDQLSFLNIHYYAAAATKYGTLAKGGYEYDGNSYDAMFAHVEGYDTCNECHNPHTLELKLEECAPVMRTTKWRSRSADDLKNIRMQGSGVDYDGDDDTDEGIYFEIEGLQGSPARQHPGLRQRSRRRGSRLHAGCAYPYWYIDANGDGELTEDEPTRRPLCQSWTPRLLQAAYNYQVSKKDPGNYAHGGKYTIQLLYDSIASLNEQVADADRHDGHAPHRRRPLRRLRRSVPPLGRRRRRAWLVRQVPFGRRSAAVPGEGVNTSQPIANGFQCATCHNDLQEYTIFETTERQVPERRRHRQRPPGFQPVHELSHGARVWRQRGSS
jgi:hypothetical protein